MHHNVVKPRSKGFYDRLANTLKQHTQNCFPNAKIRPVGSRAKGGFQRKSDFDFQFCIPGTNLSRDKIYDKLVAYLQTKIPTFEEEQLNIRKGTNGNVVNVSPEQGGKVSFALVPCDWF